MSPARELILRACRTEYKANYKKSLWTGSKLNEPTTTKRPHRTDANPNIDRTWEQYIFVLGDIDKFKSFAVHNKKSVY